MVSLSLCTTCAGCRQDEIKGDDSDLLFGASIGSDGSVALAGTAGGQFQVIRLDADGEFVWRFKVWFYCNRFRLDPRTVGLNAVRNLFVGLTVRCHTKHVVASWCIFLATSMSACWNTYVWIVQTTKYLKRVHHVMRLSTSLSKSSRVCDVRSIPVTDEQRLRSGNFIYYCFIAWVIDRPSTQGRLDYCSLHYVFSPLGESARDPPRICRVRFGTWSTDLVLRMAPFVRIIDPRWNWDLADNVPGAVL